MSQLLKSNFTGKINDRRIRLFLATLLILLLDVVPGMLYFFGKISLNTTFIVIGLIANLIMILGMVFEYLAELLKELLYKLHLRRKPVVFLIDYVISDYRWAKWLEKQLIDEGFSNKIKLREWDISQINPKDFKAEMKEASTDAEYIILVASKNYLENVLSSKKGLDKFKRQVERGKAIFVNVIDTDKLDEALKSFLRIKFRINLMGPRINAPQAIDLFLNGLPDKARKLFSRSLAGSGEDDEVRFPGYIPDEWNIPPRNAFFTAREQILEQINSNFQHTKSQALTGLQGIGTTEIAKEYAYRNHEKYNWGLWIQMTPVKEREKDLQKISHLLKLQTDNGTIEELRISLMDKLNAEGEWILVLDKCEDPAIVETFIPEQKRGDILLTTSVRALDHYINLVPVNEMKEDEGASFLLRLARKIHPDETLWNAFKEDRETAQKISRELGGFPKALYHAGILIYRGMTVQEFYTAYTKQRNKLKSHYSDHFGADIYTWYIAFDKFKTGNPNASELLRFCAFLNSETIPLEIIRKATQYNGVIASFFKDDLDLIKAITDLQRYCLLERDGADAININRVVQTVLRDEMDAATKKSYAEQAVLAVNDVFPDPRQTNGPEKGQYISHAIVCAEFIKDYQIASLEAAQLLNKLTEYKLRRGYIEEAQEYSRRANEIIDPLQKVGNKP